MFYPKKTCWKKPLQSKDLNTENISKKEDVKGNANFCSNYFSVNVSVLAVVFRQQIKKPQQFHIKLSGFLNLSVKYNS